jgi:hypothetical protein
MSKYFFFVLFSGSLLACNKINEKDIEGKWIINQLIYDGTTVEPEFRPHQKIFIVMSAPRPYENKTTATFSRSGMTCEFPGIKSYNILLRWTLENDKLYIDADSSLVNENLLLPLQNLAMQLKFDTSENSKKLYELKKDSILQEAGMARLKMPLLVYPGIYKIEKRREKLLLSSKHTTMELVNYDEAQKQMINQMFNNIK